MSVLFKLRKMLLLDQQRMAIGLFGLMLIGMLLETLGIGLVIPALALMTQSDLILKYPVIESWMNSLGNPKHEWLVIAGMLVLVGVYTVKVLFLGFLAWRQGRFSYGLQASLSQRLFVGYLRQPYTFHLQRNSAQLIRNVIGQVNGIINVIQMGMILIMEILVLMGVSILLLYIEPIGALLVMSVFAVVGWSFYRVTKGRLLRWGEARQHHEGMRIQHLQQGLGSAKDVKLLGREDDFLNQYFVHTSGSARMSQRQFTLQALPRLWLELLAVICLAALVFVMIVQGKPVDALLPVLGVFAAAAFRVMPSVNRVLGAVQSIRFSLPIIESLHDEFGLLVNSNAIQNSNQPIQFKKALELDNVIYGYSSTESVALKGITLSIIRGSSVGFIGGSGAGKSTLVDIILGLLTPDSGTIKADGIDIQTHMRSWQDQIGYVPQSIYLTDDTLRRNIAFGLANDQIDDAAVWRAINAAQLEEFVNELPLGTETMVGERGVRLSGGQRQRIGIARALYHEPPVLVLDEATSSLDIATEREVMDAVNALHGNKTVLIVAHRLSTVEHCDYLYRLEKGVIIDEGDSLKVLGGLTAKKSNEN